MAVITNTVRTSNATTNKETLADVVSRIDPEDTPIYTMLPKGSAEGIHPEWITDSLEAPGDNAREEGEEYTFDKADPPVRPGNYTQIFRKDWIISGSQEAASEAGNVLKRKYQKAKKGVGIRKDVEFSILSNTPSQAGVVRRSGGLPTWITSNVSRGSGGANGGFVGGVTTPATNGMQRAFTKTLMDGVMQQGFNNGAKFKKVVGSSYIKSVFVSIMSDANVAPFRYSVDSGEGNTMVATADYYEGPFGKVMVEPNVVQSASPTLARNVFFIDPEFASWLWFRKIQEDKEVAKTGDADKGVIIGEGCLKVANEKGLGIVADVFGMTASS
ncbi:head protein [Metarhizobium album]|uniref:Head protein n=1 Tax=Metarhizobium album TaxID=2182425 RepID=A0A2U2DUZ7_9HYPH|nr:DUF5309 domain-containing protein [Rhizobium album]PWE57138.1 head protein [Rhizobium album]